MRVGSSRWLRALWAALSLAVMAGLWIFLAPTAVGGQANYVIVAGASMEPALRRGDLVIVRQAPDYQPGDVVTYRHPVLGPVIHRILRQDGARYVMKGDSNHWIDSYQPTADQILGRQWVRVPRLGEVFQRARQPALLAGAAFLLMLMGVVAPSYKERDQASKASTGWTIARINDELVETLLVIFGALLFSSLMLSLYAFSQPEQRMVKREIPYTYHSLFAYQAPAPLEVYSEGRVRTGEPAFLRLVQSLEFDYSFKLTSEAPSQVSGTYQMLAVLRDATGWERPIALGPEQSFTGNSFEAHAVLDLQAVRVEMERFQQLTDRYISSFQLAVAPRITLQGNLGERQLKEVYQPEMLFLIDEVQLRLISQEKIRPGQGWPLDDERVMVKETMQPATLSLFFWQVPVKAARAAALLAGALGILGLAAVGWITLQVSQEGEDRRIQLRYGSLLVEVTNNSMAMAKKKVEVASIDDLARLAERLGRMILYKRQRGGITYGVEAAGVYYLYRLPLASRPEVLRIEQPPRQVRGLDWRRAIANGAMGLVGWLRQTGAHLQQAWGRLLARVRR